MKKKKFTEVNPYSRTALRKAVIDDLTQGQAGFNCAVTLTFPKNKVNSRSAAQKKCTYFRDLYNTTFGFEKNHRRAAKYDKKLSAPFAAFIEGDGKEKHFHYHLAMRRPDNLSLQCYEAILAKLWRDVLNEEEARIAVEDIYNQGWAEYITKEFKTGDADAIDEMNYNVF